MKKITLIASVAAVALVGVTFTTHAETVHTETYVDTQDIENSEHIDFSVFDINNDGLYSKSEVGTKLFHVFDRDGNNFIDNIEWNDKRVYTITPMEKETFRFVDYNDDGSTDFSSYTYETFYEESGLIRFDNNKNGLSASEFIGEGFQSLDDNDNNMIELDEWEDAYIKSLKAENANQDNYN